MISEDGELGRILVLAHLQAALFRGRSGADDRILLTLAKGGKGRLVDDHDIARKPLRCRNSSAASPRLPDRRRSRRGNVRVEVARANAAPICDASTSTGMPPISSTRRLVSAL